MCEMCRLNSIQKLDPSRRKMLGLAAASTVGFLLSSSAGAKQTKPPPKPQNVMTPAASLERLLKGNERYVEGVSRRHDFKHEREALAGGQNPFAAILSCADSRIAARNMPLTAAAAIFSFAAWRATSPTTRASQVSNTPWPNLVRR